MTNRLFDTYVMVDWSAASVPSTGADSIWIGIACDGGPTTVENIATRSEAIERLIDLLATERDTGRRILAGFDFPFGYPAGVARKVTGQSSALALWDWLSDRIEDGPDNRNNRFDVASEINRLFDGVGPFWGRPASWNYQDVPTKKSERMGNGHPREFRYAEYAAKGAKSVWQLAYAGAVGSQVLVGLPALNRIRRDERIALDVAVWPFETGLSASQKQITIAEIYPSLIPSDPREETKDAGQVRAVADWLAKLDECGGLEALLRGPTELDHAAIGEISAEEAWILGADTTVITANSQRLRYERDPHAIYRQSFATVEAEARLDHLPADLRPVAIRLVHACGMVDLPNRLAWSDDVGSRARAALEAGAPVLCDCEMVASGIVRGRLPAENPIVCTLNDRTVPALAETIRNTRSAAAVELWCDRTEGAVVVIGNAPTALFHLLELLDAGWPKPAAIVGFPVGFVGAAESKAELAADPRGVPFLTLRGRRGGSAMAAAALNAMAAGLEPPR